MAFYKNKVWLLFFFSLQSVTLYYTSIALYELYTYNRLNEEIIATKVTPVIIKKNEESYLLAAEYSFVYKNASYIGKDNKLYHPFWNAWAAEKEAKALSDNKQKVFFSAENPHISALSKFFPLKALISALVLWGVQIYLFFVGKKYA